MVPSDDVVASSGFDGACLVGVAVGGDTEKETVMTVVDIEVTRRGDGEVVQVDVEVFSLVRVEMVEVLAVLLLTVNGKKGGLWDKSWLNDGVDVMRVDGT